MPKEIGKTRRQTIRVVHDLKNRGLIYLARTEKSEKGGKEKNIWKITFDGIMEILKFLDSKSIKLIAERHEDLWVVFEERDFLIDFFGEQDFYTRLRFVSSKCNNLSFEKINPYTNKELDMKGYSLDQWEKIQISLEDRKKQKLTNIFLDIEFFNDPLDFFIQLQSYPENARKECLSGITEELNDYFKNDKIKEHIEKQFNQIKTTLSFIQKIGS